MSSYYELLGIVPGASVTEVEDAYQARYDYWRRLVTSHDRGRANEANVMLQQLETARTVLLDLQKRAAYDLSLIPADSVGGLADPAASAAAKPQAFSSRPAFGIAGHVSDTGACPRCGSTENPPGARFCIKCQNSLMQSCPKCQADLPSHYANCPQCGCNIAEERQRQQQLALEMDDRRRQRAMEEAARSEQELRSNLARAELLLAQGTWRSAKDQLAGFEGLGNKRWIGSTPVSVSRSHPLWPQAQAIQRSANVLRKQARRASIMLATWVYGGLGLFFTFLLMILAGAARGAGDESLSLGGGLAYALLIGGFFLITGVLGAFVYTETFGGRRSASSDRFIGGTVAPLIVGMVAGSGCGLIAIALVVFTTLFRSDDA